MHLGVVMSMGMRDWIDVTIMLAICIVFAMAASVGVAWLIGTMGWAHLFCVDCCQWTGGA